MQQGIYLMLVFSKFAFSSWLWAEGWLPCCTACRRWGCSGHLQTPSCNIPQASTCDSSSSNGEVILQDGQLQLRFDLESYRGPGAGAEVTAAGVFGDLVQLARCLGPASS